MWFNGVKIDTRGRIIMEGPNVQSYVVYETRVINIRNSSEVRMSVFN